MAIDAWATVMDYASLQRGNTYPGELVGAPGPALLGLGSIAPGGGFRIDHYKTFGGECPPKITVGPGGIYVALKGATKDGSMVGSVARVPRDIGSGRLTQDTARLDFFDPAPEVAAHIYWVLRTPQYRQYCEGRLTGSASASFSRHDFLSYPVPPITTITRSIVDSLEAIEGKIELNRRMNETLEAIARALFKSWFVDFDPVRAKAEGRDPGLPAHLADHFSDSFEDSELGEIPAGLRVVKTGGLVVLSRDALNPGDFPDEQFDHYSIPAFDDQRRPKAEAGGAIKSSKLLVQPEAVLVSKLNPRIPRIWMPRVDGSRRAICSTEFFVTLPRPGVPREYLQSLFSSRAFSSMLETLVGGTSGSHQRVQPEAFLSIEVALPPLGLMAEFTKTVRPIVSRTSQALAESKSLAVARDAMLPRLVSAWRPHGRLEYCDHDEARHPRWI